MLPSNSVPLLSLRLVWQAEWYVRLEQDACLRRNPANDKQAVRGLLATAELDVPYV